MGNVLFSIIWLIILIFIGFWIAGIAAGFYILIIPFTVCIEALTGLTDFLLKVYRNLQTVTDADLETVKRNFTWIKDQLDHLKPTIHHKVVVFMGSPADQDHCVKIARAARDLGLDVDLRVTSAHKATEETLRIMQQYEDTHGALVFIAVAGRSNGLGPVLSGNTSYPVINCPPPSDKLVQDIWSSLSVPSGLGCATVLYPDSAALMAAQIIGLQDYLVWGRLRAKQLDMAAGLRQADKKLRYLQL